MVAAAVALVVLVLVSLFLFLPGSGPGCTSTWKCGAGYPIQVAGNVGVGATQCEPNGAYLFCVGGSDANSGARNETYIGALGASGNLTGWALSTNEYPTGISGESCVVSSGYLYCVGGVYDPGGDDIATSYYSQLGAGGSLGAWFYTTAYPIPIDAESCVSSSSYIYCVGGNNETDGIDGTVAPSSSSWYAQLTSTGIGAWSKTASYPTNAYLPSCFATGQVIYCIGGVDSSDNPLGNVYYASLSGSGIGDWIPTTAYPLPATGQACSASMGYVYCVGGATSGGQSASYTNAVYATTISSEGLGTWTSGPDFPSSVATTCITSSGYLYCIGGFDASYLGVEGAVRYASLASL